LITPGDSYRVVKRLYHVRAIVDDDQVVVRCWSRKWGGVWSYSVKQLDVLEILLADGTYKRERSRRDPDAPTP
jgi:hypothetical protein